MLNTGDGVCAIKEEFIIKKGVFNNTHLKHKLDEVNSSEISERKESHELVKRRGQNKARPKVFRDDKSSKPCPSIVNLTTDGAKSAQCQYKNCVFVHDPVEYVKQKPADVGPECHVYKLKGKCPRGISCRFGSSHITPEGLNVIDHEKEKKWTEDTVNTIQSSLQMQLQKRTYDFSLSENLVKHYLYKKHELAKDCHTNNLDDSKNSGSLTDEDVIKLTQREKKKIDWRDKLYLSPLTTVGNLPFRRICKEFGADITCGEMALCQSMVKGAKQEWALAKRHISEDMFGVQICGNNAYLIAKVAQLVEENSKVDFIDLNLGCPIDLIYKKGGGCGLMHRLPILETSVRSASTLLSVPFTVKMRTGIYQDKKIAHTVMPQVAAWGASLITLHGRSKEARYTRLADWEYIESCAKVAEHCPVYGNGDIFSYEDYAQRRQIAPTIQGVMIGRGALIKPWIFTEIKEQKIWDISSAERFEIIKKYTNYGLEHWGSDTQGVESTRRFLLEWLSFLYRYVPVGLLERPPQKINERPPTYHGRDELESMMASGNCANWIKISEMLLGPVPDGFRFLPKHKANSYQ